MNTVTIKLPVEKDETEKEALSNFQKNISKLLENNFNYQPEAVFDQSDRLVFVALSITDPGLKNLLDAAPGNNFEIMDRNWPEFLKEKEEKGADLFKIPDMET